MRFKKNTLEGTNSRITEAEDKIRRSLVGYSPWGYRELDKTERLSANTHKYLTTNFCVEICFHFSWMYTWE